MRFEYKRGGRKVSSKQFFDGLGKEVIKKAESHIERKLRQLRDPKTGKPVKIVKRRVGGNLTWDVEGSPEAIQAAKRILRGL